MWHHRDYIVSQAETSDQASETSFKEDGDGCGTDAEEEGSGLHRAPTAVPY